MPKQNSKLQTLLDTVKELNEDEENDYYELPFIEVVTLTSGAALFKFEPHMFKVSGTSEAMEPVWFPRAALRQFDGDIYFQNKLALNKGLK